MSELELEKTQWFQSLFICLTVPGLLEVPERKALVTLFSTNKSETFSGRLRFYILNSVEQISQVMLENPEYKWQGGFLEYVKAAEQNGILPSYSDGLPEAEMTEHTHLVALAAATIDLVMRESFKAAQAEQQDVIATWSGGEKGKA